MPFKAGEVNHKIEMAWRSGEGKPYLRTLSPALAKAFDLRTKKGREFALRCERLALLSDDNLKLVDELVARIENRKQFGIHEGN